MKTNKHYYVKHNSAFGTSIIRIMLALCMLIGGMCLTSYFYFFPGSAENQSISCNLPSPSFASTGPPEQDFKSIESDTCPTNTNGGCQEIIDVTGQGDTLSSLFGANLMDDTSSKKIAVELASKIRTTLGQPFDENTQLKQGRRYEIFVDATGAFLKASVELDPANVFFAAAEDGRIKTWKEDVVLDFKTEVLVFKMQGSLTESLLCIGEGPELAAKLTNVFRWDIDFQSESVKGDSCRLLFERRYADDKPSGYGNVLCAVYDGKKTGKKTAVLFNAEYYDETGTELKKNFLRSPLSVIRVTSHFGRRFHPILGVVRHHNGVDYGAAEGTPVWAVGPGVVTFSGWSNGYGNYVCIKHDNGYESRYGHLRKSFVQVGQRVKQKQRIGLVGMTGIASGPHLDFQLLLNNKHINPLSVKMVKSLRCVPSGLKPRFSFVAAERFSLMGKPASIHASEKSTTVIQ